MIAVIALLVLGDLAIVTVRLTSSRPGSTAPVAQAGSNPSAHPCNHGDYVSQAAHAHKGGAYVSGIARGKLGKQGGCSAPLPAQPSDPGGPGD